MMNETAIFVITLFAPLAGVVASLVIPSASHRVHRGIATVTMFVTLAGAMKLLGLSCHGVTGINESWIGLIGARFHVQADAISSLFLMLAALVGLTSLASSRRIETMAREYYLLVQTLLSGVMVALVAQDLLLFYVACEIDVLCSFLLILCWGDLKGTATSKTVSYAAMQLCLFLGAASLLMLVGFWTLYHAGGRSFDLSVLREVLAAQPLPVSLQAWVFLALLIAFGTLLSSWPCHVWAPLGYAAAPTGVSVLGGGVLKVLGVVGLTRFAIPLLPAGAAQWAGVMAVVATISILYGGWLALRQTDWKMLIGYGSVSHMGYVMLGIASMNTTAHVGVIIIMLAHGLSVALVFALLGHAEEVTGVRRIDAVSGLVRRMPFAGVSTLLALLAVCGLPGFASFWGEVMVFAGAWSVGGMAFKVGTIAAVWALVLTATYVLGGIRTTFFGQARSGGAEADIQSPFFRVVCALLLALLIVLGVFPRIITDGIRNRVEEDRAPAGVSVEFLGDHP